MFNLERARELKKGQGRETKWLADRCGVEHKTMQAYFRGIVRPSVAVTKLMAIAFEVPESELLTDKDQNNEAA